MSPRIKNVPDWAESQFALLCDAFGAVRNKSSHDRTGWDYLVEFEAEPAPTLPHDRQPGSASARVQVKSCTTRRKQTQLKLSNALRFCRQTEPCFIALFALSRDGNDCRIFAREFDEHLIADVLKRARQADHDGALHLNRIKFPIIFSGDDDHTGDLIHWVQQITTRNPVAYAQRKAKLNETLGYNPKKVLGTFRLRTSEIETLIEHSLGLTPSVDIDHVELRDERFDIPARLPFFAGKPDHFQLRVHPKRAQLTFKDETGLSATFDGEFRALNVPGLDASFGRATFISPNVRANLNATGKLHLSFEFANAETLSLAELQNQVNFRRIRASGMTVTLSVEGVGDLVSERVHMDSKLGDDDWVDWFNGALAALAKVVRVADKPRFSLDDLATSWRQVDVFVAAVTDANLRAEIGVENPLPERVSPRQIAYYACIEIGASTFSVIATRPVSFVQECDGTLSITFGWPLIHDHSAKRESLGKHLPKLRRAFRDLVARLGPGTVTVAAGDFMSAGIGPADIEITT